jgi:hypothetical protein
VYASGDPSHDRTEGQSYDCLGDLFFAIRDDYGTLPEC